MMMSYGPLRICCSSDVRMWSGPNGLNPSFGRWMIYLRILGGMIT